MTTKTNVKNLRQYKSTFFTVGKILAFPSSTKLVTEVKSLSPDFKQIAGQCFTL